VNDSAGSPCVAAGLLAPAARAPHGHARADIGPADIRLTRRRAGFERHNGLESVGGERHLRALSETHMLHSLEMDHQSARMQQCDAENDMLAHPRYRDRGIAAAFGEMHVRQAKPRGERPARALRRSRRDDEPLRAEMLHPKLVLLGHFGDRPSPDERMRGDQHDQHRGNPD
jgi:GNAT superfamily N-acetyltransferase